MIITPIMSKVTQDILAEKTPTATLASGIIMHCSGDTQMVMDTVKAGDDIKSLELFKIPEMVLGLFLAYQKDFLTAINESAFAHHKQAHEHLKSLTDDKIGSITHSLNMVRDYDLFETSTTEQKRDCYNLIHFIVTFVITHIMANCNLKVGLLAAQTEAYEKSIAK